VIRLPRSPASAWAATRVLFGSALLLEWIPRAAHLEELYSSESVIVYRPPFSITDTVIWSPTTAWILWSLLVGSLVLVVFGRVVRLALGVFLLTSLSLMLFETLHLKAYDRLAFWQTLALLFAPWGDRTEDPPRRGGVARYMLLVTYVALYVGTGFSKARAGEGWIMGDALAYHFVALGVGGLPLGVFLSGIPWAMALLAWFTIAFECLFPIAIWLRRTSAWILLAGIVFHVGILLTMRVGAFSLISIAPYPVLLHPDVWRRLEGRLRARLPFTRRAGPAAA
jgi:hypothetical protein